jgi:ring-1,2-phenylacetyl-CoA epoxidase subunit PaaC
MTANTAGAMTANTAGATTANAPTSATPSVDALTPAIGAALTGLLLTLADDEFVVGFADSEWTGIAPLLEEDVAMSSLAQDELGHARAFYRLLGDLVGDDPDHLAYDRPPEEFRHCRLLDHPRGDWAFTIARRYLYDTADSVRLEAIDRSSYAPLAELVAKIRREERYHLMHVEAWLRRLATALETLGPDAASVFAPIPGEGELLESGVLPVSMVELRDRWLATIGPTLSELGLPAPTPDGARAGAREDHSDAFRWLWTEFTMVRKLDPEATW